MEGTTMLEKRTISKMLEEGPENERFLRGTTRWKRDHWQNKRIMFSIQRINLESIEHNRTKRKEKIWKCKVSTRRSLGVHS